MSSSKTNVRTHNLEIVQRRRGALYADSEVTAGLKRLGIKSETLNALDAGLSNQSSGKRSDLYRRAISIPHRRLDGGTSKYVYVRIDGITENGAAGVWSTGEPETYYAEPEMGQSTVIVCDMKELLAIKQLSEATDVNVLHELKATLDEVGVYEWSEVEDFCTRFFDGEDAQNLSPLIDGAAERFNEELNLDDKDKIDFKIKAKQFVKIYGQMASIMPFEVLNWEKLFWFLKFLVPKLKIKDPNQDALDELLESVDLSSYGLGRTKLGHSIKLDASETELEPQNPNPRGYREGDPQQDPLEEIIRSFNERWFQGWSATPEEQRVKFLNIVESVQAHPDYEEKFSDNPDPFSRDLAFEKIMKEVMLKRRKEELELYKLHSQDQAFKSSLYQSIKEALNRRN